MKAQRRSAWNIGVFLLIYPLFIPIWLDANSGKSGFDPGPQQTQVTSEIRKQFRGLKTNLFIHSIDLTLVFDGGPSPVPFGTSRNDWYAYASIAFSADRSLSQQLYSTVYL